tara:strand:+ start:1582 stop:2289 length:708 start_codon:yes stop_codon:yes gene_type:complete
MVVEIFSIVRDQEHILPLYFKHYNEIFDNPIFNIYDNGSIDNSIKICKEQKNCNITKVSYSKYINEINVTGLGTEDNKGWYGTIGDIQDYLEFNKNAHAFINSREYSPDADWICMIDPDELIQITSDELSKEKADVIRFTGYQMVNKDKLNLDELTLGYKDYRYNKPVLFRSTVDINFTMGAHDANPVNKNGEEIKWSEPFDKEFNYKYKLLHYSRKWMDLSIYEMFNTPIEKIK